MTLAEISIRGHIRVPGRYEPGSEEIKNGSDRIEILTDFDAQNGRRLMFRKEKDRIIFSLG